jgi:hypothetical protein
MNVSPWEEGRRVFEDCQGFEAGGRAGGRADWWKALAITYFVAVGAQHERDPLGPVLPALNETERLGLHDVAVQHGARAEEAVEDVGQVRQDEVADVARRSVPRVHDRAWARCAEALGAALAGDGAVQPLF